VRCGKKATDQKRTASADQIGLLHAQWFRHAIATASRNNSMKPCLTPTGEVSVCIVAMAGWLV